MQTFWLLVLFEMLNFPPRVSGTRAGLCVLDLVPILTWHGLNCDHDGTLSPFHCTSVRIDDTVVAPMS